jgi:hypothetical protein
MWGEKNQKTSFCIEFWFLIILKRLKTYLSIHQFFNQFFNEHFFKFLFIFEIPITNGFLVLIFSQKNEN